MSQKRQSLRKKKKSKEKEKYIKRVIPRAEIVCGGGGGG